MADEPTPGGGAGVHRAKCVVLPLTRRHPVHAYQHQTAHPHPSSYSNTHTDTPFRLVPPSHTAVFVAAMVAIFLLNGVAHASLYLQFAHPLRPSTLPAPPTPAIQHRPTEINTLNQRLQKPREERLARKGGGRGDKRRRQGNGKVTPAREMLERDLVLCRKFLSLPLLFVCLST